MPVPKGSPLTFAQGIVYFVSHRALWKPFMSKLGPTLTLSAGVLAGMFAFTYLPQLAVLVFVEGPLAVFSTVLLVLNESSTLVSTISKTWVLQDALLDTFDGTLVARNSTNLVKGGREIKSGSDPIAKLGKIIKSPFERFTPSALIRYVMYLPLNFIPVVGTIIFITLQGRTRGKSVHDRYFQLKGWNSRQKSDWLQEHVGPYTAYVLPLLSLYSGLCRFSADSACSLASVPLLPFSRWSPSSASSFHSPMPSVPRYGLRT